MRTSVELVKEGNPKLKARMLILKASRCSIISEATSPQFRLSVRRNTSWANPLVVLVEKCWVVRSQVLIILLQPIDITAQGCRLHRPRHLGKQHPFTLLLPAVHQVALRHSPRRQVLRLRSQMHLVDTHLLEDIHHLPEVMGLLGVTRPTIRRQVLRFRNTALVVMTAVSRHLQEVLVSLDPLYTARHLGHHRVSHHPRVHRVREDTLLRVVIISLTAAGGGKADPDYEFLDLPLLYLTLSENSV